MCEYPCEKCENNKTCGHNGRGKNCERWLNWFSEKWQEIRKNFGVECVDSTLKEKECDNENS